MEGKGSKRPSILLTQPGQRAERTPVPEATAEPPAVPLLTLVEDSGWKRSIWDPAGRSAPALMQCRPFPGLAPVLRSSVLPRASCRSGAEAGSSGELMAPVTLAPGCSFCLADCRPSSRLTYRNSLCSNQFGAVESQMLFHVTGRERI